MGGGGIMEGLGGQAESLCVCARALACALACACVVCSRVCAAVCARACLRACVFARVPGWKLGERGSLSSSSLISGAAGAVSPAPVYLLDNRQHSDYLLGVSTTYSRATIY